MKSLEGKIALITGGTSGMGLAVAKKFISEGAFVFITGRRQPQLDAAVELLGDNAMGVQGNAGNLEDLDRLFSVIMTVKGRLDIVYANAGAAKVGALGQITEAQFDEMIGVNMRGTLFTVQKALPLFKSTGSIILVGSIAGAKGRAGRSVYNASKASLRSFARTWANELGSRGIRVNVLSPGPVDTAALAGASKEVRNQLASQIPRGEIGQPEEVANVALFLASDASGYVNGIELFSDGGAAQV